MEKVTFERVFPDDVTLWNSPRVFLADDKMTESTPKAKRVRKANWQPRETEMLVEFVSANSDILNSSFNAAVTNKQKLTLWDTITNR